jgi:ABC-type maltose transport system permease subunit
MNQNTPLVTAPKRKSFFRSGREDSLFKRMIIHVVLIFFCIIAIYPVLRVFSVSLYGSVDHPR